MIQLLKNAFSGHYSFARDISSPQGSFTGTATFGNGPDNQILYREEGQSDLGQIFYQKRIFVIDDSRLTIYKIDNSLLHEFKVDPLQKFPIKLTHTHHCKDDQYSLTLEMKSNDSFSMAYVVKGPAKDYRIHTDFTRSYL